MITSLSIKNYALIEKLTIDFSKGFSTITGETGAGKSIILGAIGLVLGKRADLSSLKNKEEKCIIEAQFEISKYNLLIMKKILLYVERFYLLESPELLLTIVQ